MADDVRAGRRAAARRWPGAPWRRLPFTTAVVSVMLAAGAVTGSLWSAADKSPWYPSVAYGLPAFVEGRWWTVLTGPFFAIQPLAYLPMAGTFALFVGVAEHRAGTRAAAMVAAVGQAGGVLVAAALLLALRGTGWPWAVATAAARDVGFSAGALAAAAVTSRLLRPPWGLRMRLGLLVYVVASIVYLGSIADLEHLIAVLGVLALGRWPARWFGGPPPSPVADGEWRLLAAAGLVVVAAGAVVHHAVPGNGPLGGTDDPTGSLADVVLTVVAAALLVTGLRAGRRGAWRWAVALAGLNALAGAALVVLLGVALAADLDAVLATAPAFVAGRVGWTALLVVLVLGRHAFRGPVSGGR